MSTRKRSGDTRLSMILWAGMVPKSPPERISVSTIQVLIDFPSDRVVSGGDREE